MSGIFPDPFFFDAESFFFTISLPHPPEVMPAPLLNPHFIEALQ